MVAGTVTSSAVPGASAWDVVVGDRFIVAVAAPSPDMTTSALAAAAADDTVTVEALVGMIPLGGADAVESFAIVWWPGVSRWKRSLGIKVTAGWRRVNWDLHSALGFWLFLFLLMWGISGWYLGMPEPLTNLMERLSDPDGPYGERPGDIALQWLPRLHFGRWRNPGWGTWLQALWAVVGLVPAIMFVTGLIMWWNRVVRKRRSAAEAISELV